MAKTYEEQKAYALKRIAKLREVIETEEYELNDDTLEARDVELLAGRIDDAICAILH